VIDVRTARTVLFTVAVSLTCIYATAAESINWMPDYETAIASAKVAKKPVMVYFYGETCPWCDRMSEDVHANTDIIELLDSSFVSVKLISADSRDLGMRLGFTGGVPATAFIMPDETVLGLVSGYRDGALFTSLAKQALKYSEKSDRYKALAEKRDDETATVDEGAELLTFYNHSAQKQKALDLVTYIEGRSSEDDEHSESYLLDRAVAVVDTRASAMGRADIQKWVDDHTAEHARYYEAMYWLGLGTAYGDDLEGAEKIWTAVTEKAPDTLWANYAAFYLNMIKQMKNRQG
jgi:thiol-disulfide isomerase/thioredoxin